MLICFQVILTFLKPTNPVFYTFSNTNTSPNAFPPCISLAFHISFFSQVQNKIAICRKKNLNKMLFPERVKRWRMSFQLVSVKFPRLRFEKTYWQLLFRANKHCQCPRCLFLIICNANGQQQHIMKRY